MATSEGNFIAEVDRDDEADRPVVRAGVLAWRAEGVGEMALAFGVSACRFPALGRQRPNSGRFPAQNHYFETIGERPAASTRRRHAAMPSSTQRAEPALIRTALPWRVTVHFCTKEQRANSRADYGRD